MFSKEVNTYIGFNLFALDRTIMRMFCLTFFQPAMPRRRKTNEKKKKKIMSNPTPAKLFSHGESSIEL